MAKKEKEIKIKIKKSRKDKDFIKDLSGPQMNDIHQKSSRWNKLPVKNIVKIKASRKTSGSKKSVAFKFMTALIVFILLGGSIFSFLYLKFSVLNDRIATVMPEESSLYGKVNLDKLINLPNNDQSLAFNGKADFISNYFVNQINDNIFSFGLDFNSDLKNILGKDLAFSYIDNGDSSGFVFANQITDIVSTQNLIDKAKYKTNITEENYDSFTIYQMSEKEGENEIFLTLLDDLLIVSKKRACVIAVVDTFLNKRLNLTQKQQFKKSVPIFEWGEVAYLYFQPQDISKLVSYDSNALKIWDAATYNVSSAYLSLNEGENGLSFQVKLNDYQQSSMPGISQELLDILPADTSGLIAGQNFSQDFIDLKQDLSESNPALEFYLAEFLRKIEEQAQVNEEDLTEFFSNEFLLSFDYAGDKFNYNLITKFSDNAQASQGVQVFEEAISNYYGNLYPKTQPMTLSDGTEAMELIPDPESYQFNDIDFEGQVARGIVNDQVEHEITYILQDNMVIISTSLGSLKNLVSVSSENDKLINKRFFNLPYSQVKSYHTGNLIYFDSQVLQDFYKFDNLLGKSLSLFDTFAVASRASNNNLYLKGFFYLE